MNFGNLKTLARAYVPQAKVQSISNATLAIMLNEAALQVNSDLGLLKVYELFNVTADAVTYNLTSLLTRYQRMTKEGLWYNDGSDWLELDPYTQKKMNDEFPNWLDDGSAEPLRYWLYGENLYVNPPDDTTRTDGFRIHFVQKPLTMSSDGHFPFHLDGVQTTERTDLAICSEAVLLYWEEKALKILGKKQESVAKIAEYDREILKLAKALNIDEDIAHNKYAKFQGPRIGC